MSDVITTTETQTIVTPTDSGAVITTTETQTIVAEGTSGPQGAQGPQGNPGANGTGNVDGPASATDNAIARFDGSTGKVIQNSAIQIDDAGNITIPNDIQLSFNGGTSSSNAFKTGSDGSFLFDIGGGNNTAIKGGDTAGAKQLRFANGSWQTVWYVDTLGRSHQNGGLSTDGAVSAAGLQVTGGSPADGKVLTADSSGNATWQPATYSQAFTSQSTVVVNHNLGKYPSVLVVDSAGDQCEGDVDHLSTNQFTVTFGVPFSGMIYCN